MEGRSPNNGSAQAAGPANRVTPGEVAACLRLLQRIRDEPALAAELPELAEGVARAYKAVRKDRRRRAERAGL